MIYPGVTFEPYPGLWMIWRAMHERCGSCGRQWLPRIHDCFEEGGMG